MKRESGAGAGVSVRKSRFVRSQTIKIEDHYESIKELGSGCFGRVFRVRDKFSGEIRACKAINKNKIIRAERYKTEIEILQKADHHNIVKLLEIIEDDTFIYLIMEECKGGELSTVLADRSKSGNFLSELEAADLFKQIICALVYLHKNGICHRDLKAQNILFYDKNTSHLKIIDFGLSKIFKMDGLKPKSPMNSIVGTLYYSSPEVLKGEYNEKCDVWSAGIILYYTLCGRPPFLSCDIKELEEKILKFNFNFEGEGESHHSKLSKEAQDLFSKILVSDGSRISAEEILKHDWINKFFPYSTDHIKFLDLHYFH